MCLHFSFFFPFGASVNLNLGRQKVKVSARRQQKRACVDFTRVFGVLGNIERESWAIPANLIGLLPRGFKVSRSSSILSRRTSVLS